MSRTLLTTEQAAAELGVNDPRVRQLNRAGELMAQQFGRAYLLGPAEVRKLVGMIGNSGKRGRPPKPEAETGSKAGKKKGGKQ